MIVLLVAAVACSLGCRREEPKSGADTFGQALRRLTNATEPGHMAGPLKRMAELAKSAPNEDLKMAARFELARGWLRLGILTGVGSKRAEAGRVMNELALTPDDVTAHFNAVATSEALKGQKLPGWATDGAELVSALTGKGLEQADRNRIIAKHALGGGGFEPEAAAVIFSYLARMPPRKAVTQAQSDKAVRDVMRYVCPDAAAKLAIDDVRERRMLAFALECVDDPIWEGKDVVALAKGEPCAGFSPSTDGLGLKTAVHAWFNLLFAAYIKGGEGGQPILIHRLFPAPMGCQLVTDLVQRLDEPTETTKKAGVAPGTGQPTAAPAEPTAAPAEPTAAPAEPETP